jgi:hypothetical protein
MLTPSQTAELLQYTSIFSDTEVRAYIDLRKLPSEVWTVRLSVTHKKTEMQRRFYSLESALEFVEDVKALFPTVRLVEKKSKASQSSRVEWRPPQI